MSSLPRGLIVKGLQRPEVLEKRRFLVVHVRGDLPIYVRSALSQHAAWSHVDEVQHPAGILDLRVWDVRAGRYVVRQ